MLTNYCRHPKKARYFYVPRTVVRKKKVRTKKGVVVRKIYDTVYDREEPTLPGNLPYGGKYIKFNYLARMVLSVLRVGTTLKCPSKSGSVDIGTCAICCVKGNDKCRGYDFLLQLKKTDGKKRIKKVTRISGIYCYRHSRLKLALKWLRKLAKNSKKIEKEYKVLRKLSPLQKTVYFAHIEQQAFKRYKETFHECYKQYDQPLDINIKRKVL